MFLFGILGSIHYGFRQGIDIAGADRLVVIGRTSMMQPLPITYLSRLTRVPGVRDAAHATWFGGVYQDARNFFPQFVIVPEDWRRMYPKYVVDPAQWSGFLSDRQGCVIGAKLAQRFGWAVGSRIPLKAPGYLGGGSWEFNVRAIYRGTRQGDDETQLWLRHDYFYEKAPRTGRGLSAGMWCASHAPTRRSPLPARSMRNSGTPHRKHARRPSRRSRRGSCSRWATSSSCCWRSAGRLLHAPARDREHDGHRCP